jgi:hypothetical protein
MGEMNGSRPGSSAAFEESSDRNSLIKMNKQWLISKNFRQNSMTKLQNI